jgi:hypothetical protein
MCKIRKVHFLAVNGLLWTAIGTKIHSLPGPREPIYLTFSMKGYLVIAFMITLGVTLRHIPGIPSSFFAWFYLGLGSGLLSAGIRFLIRWRKALSTCGD